MTDHSSGVLPAVHADAMALSRAELVDTSPLDQGPALFDLSDYPVLRVTGRDRTRFLHAMLSNDVASLQPGEGRWATFNDVMGRTVADLRLFVVDTDKKTGELLLLVEPGAEEALVEGLDHFLISEKVAFERLEDLSLWVVSGQGADTLLKGKGAELPTSELYAHCSTEVAGVPCRILRLDRSHPEGGDLGILVSSAEARALCEGLGEVSLGSRDLLEAARVEAGQPRFGVDLTSDNIPLEAGLKDRAISFTKGCYIGQEVICRIDSLGSPKRRLVQLSGPLSSGAAPGLPLFIDGKVVGELTSVVQSARHEGTQAMGYLGKRHLEQGTQVRMGSAEGAEFSVGRLVGTP